MARAAQNISWKRLAVESAAIVASILLAFAIDAWWINRVERMEEQEVLGSLKSELKGNIEQIQLSLDFRVAAAEAVLDLLKASAQEGELTLPELDQRLGSLAGGKRQICLSACSMELSKVVRYD